jgi:hypothetical protein
MIGHESQVAQFLILTATALFVGARFLPSRFRQRTGIALTVCYVAGFAMFMVYLLLR